jgi:hypothetical protein
MFIYHVIIIDMPPKKVTLTDAQKHALCVYARDNKKTRTQYIDWIEEQWGVRVDESTISRILKTKEKRLNIEVLNPDKKRHKPVTFPHVEQAIKEFVLNYQHRTILSDAIIVEKAKLIADGLGVPQGALLFSAGWLHKFKERNGIHQQKLHGEAASADLAAIINNLPLLKDKCAGYTLERIYNMDETGLFYRLEPDRSLATRRLAGRKADKERLSIALCTNADGSHKLNPLVIGKYAKPRCFKNINTSNMPVTYRSNNKAWMITNLFQEWLQEFDHQVGRKYHGQRVLLLLDNCSSHKMGGLDLQYVDVLFLPPNTTSKIQPMDAGIIVSFKRHYRRFHIHWMIEQVEGGLRAQDLKMNVLQAIQYIIQGWSEVDAETIRNCWRHTDILPATFNADIRNLSESSCQTADLILDDLAKYLEKLRLPDPMPLDDFLTIPEEDVVYEVLEDDKIVEELVYMFGMADGDSADPDEVDDSSETPIVSASAASKGLETAYQFLLQQDDAGEQIKLLAKIEKFIREKKMSWMRQATIDQFFIFQ